MRVPTGDELKAVRERRCLTQADLAAKADVSQPLIARVESGDVDTTLATLHKIVSALNGSKSHIEDDELEVVVPTALKEARKRAGYTQGELAAAADVSQPLISRIEREDVNPRVSTLRSLFEYLDPVPENKEVESAARDTSDAEILAEIESEFETLRTDGFPEESQNDQSQVSREVHECPNCETDMSAYPDPNFCPNCGAPIES